MRVRGKARRGALAVVAVATVALGTAVYGFAGHVDGGPESYTGCLKNGTLYAVAVGDQPTEPCKANETQVHLSSGDITALQAGPGLVGGGVAGGVQLAADTSYVQRRVGSDCVDPRTFTDKSISAIHADGTVTCNVDNDSGGDVTEVDAGFGLTGGGSSGDVALAVDPTKVQKRVADFCNAGHSIRRIHENGFVECTFGPNLTAGKLNAGGGLDDDFQTIGSLPISAGSYLIIAKVTAKAVKFDAANEILGATCELSVGGDADQAIVWGDNDFAAGGTMTMMVWHKVTGAFENAVVRCRDSAEGFNLFAQMDWERLRIAAVELDLNGIEEFSLD